MEQSSLINPTINRTQVPIKGQTATGLEKVASKITSGGYMSLALGSLALSAAIAAFSKRKSMANFVGLWVPTLMLVGIYNKLTQTEDSVSTRSQKNLH